MFSRAISVGRFGMEDNSYQYQSKNIGNLGAPALRNGTQNDLSETKRNVQLEIAIRHAKEESLRLGHKYVGSEQLLIGLLRQDKAVAAMVLNSLGVSTDKARREMKNIIGYGAGMNEISEEDLHSTLLFRRIVETAFEISRRFRCDEVRTEHLLLATIANERGSVAQLTSYFLYRTAVVTWCHPLANLTSECLVEKLVHKRIGHQCTKPWQLIEKFRWH